jgi:hypothetical protein
MYVFQSALAVSKNIGSQWEIVDISSTKLVDIYTQYRKVYVTLCNIFLVNPIYIDLDELRADYTYSELTLNEMLASIGNRSLPTTNAIPTLSTKYAKFSDAFRAGYKITPLNIYESITSPILPSEKTSLRIERSIPQTDMQVFYKNCLVSINGFFHRTDCDGTYAYALNANESLFKSKQNQIGILSFYDIGEIEQVPITVDMIHKQPNNTPMKNKTYIKLNRDTTGKSIMLVLGGYLLFIDNQSLCQINEDTVSIDFTKMPLLERYFESNPYLNLKDLGLPLNTDNESVINVPEFMSDAVLTKYLMLSQSFFVLVDSTNLFTNKIYIKSSNMPGMFTAYKEPTYPLFVSNGRLAEYWKTYEDGFWSVNVQDSYLKNNVFSSNPSDFLVNISDNRMPCQTFYNSRGFLLEIGSDFI